MIWHWTITQTRSLYPLTNKQSPRKDPYMLWPTNNHSEQILVYVDQLTISQKRSLNYFDQLTNSWRCFPACSLRDHNTTSTTGNWECRILVFRLAACHADPDLGVDLLTNLLFGIFPRPDSVFHLFSQDSPCRSRLEPGDENGDLIVILCRIIIEGMQL